MYHRLSPSRSSLLGGGWDRGYHDYRRVAFDNLAHPNAPRLFPKELPPLLEDEYGQNQGTTLLGGPQRLPNFLLFHNQALPGVDARISFQERKRSVVQPSITFMPEYPDYLWGAVTSHITSRDDGMRVHFQEITEPATNPAVSRMSIATGLGEGTNLLEVQRQAEASYVTVVDIQRTVIDWLKQIRSLAPPWGGKPSVSSWVRLVDDDGQEIEVEVWAWRGLKPLDGTMERWALQYADDGIDR